MPTTSAGILVYRQTGAGLEVLLVHPGGPFWRHRDHGAWSIPKGQIDPDEEPLAAARRELREETGLDLPGPFLELGSVRQQAGKEVLAWAAAGDCDPARLRSNTFSMEWPPRSGRQCEFPEVDRAEYFALAEARVRINPGQVGLLDELARRLALD